MSFKGSCYICKVIMPVNSLFERGKGLYSV